MALHVGFNKKVAVAGALASMFAFLFFMSHFFEPARAAVILQQQSPPNLDDVKLIDEGLKLFAPTCGASHCHGTVGVGGLAPQLRGEGLKADYLFDLIANGIPGSSMPPFKSVFNEQQIWKVVAFIMSPVKDGDSPKRTSVVPASTPSSSESTSISSAPKTLVGNPAAGRAIFFDATQPRRCASCHTIDGAGASIGPDLTKAASRTPRELFLLIVLPHERVDPRFALTKLVLKDGERLTGIKKEEDQHSIRIHDPTVFPGELRSIRKGDIAAIENTNESPMPKDYATVYTMKQLLDLIAYIKSTDGQLRAAITLRDIL